MRGLPYDCKPKEVAKFFDDCKIVGGDAGVFFPTNEKWDSAMFMLGVSGFLSLVWSLTLLICRGMVTGEAFVELAGQKYLERALERHKQSLGER